MEEILIGEYCRTNDGIIGIKVEYDNGLKLKIDKDEYYKPLVDSIVKHSKNILDLLENKDIIKAKDIIDGAIVFLGVDENTIDLTYKEIREGIENKEYELLQILTHEQFENNCYTV